MQRLLLNSSACLLENCVWKSHTTLPPTGLERVWPEVTVLWAHYAWSRHVRKWRRVKTPARWLGHLLLPRPQSS